MANKITRLLVIHSEDGKLLKIYDEQWFRALYAEYRRRRQQKRGDR